MNKLNKNKIYYQIFGVIVGLTFLVWILRGVKALTFIQGWVLLLLIVLSIASGAMATWQSSRRW